MPLYEYECQQCKRHTEKIQKFSDPELTTCPHCGGSLERVLSAPAVSFKGGGWYKDLYSSAKPATNGGASTPAASGDTGSSSSASSDSGSSTAAPAASAAPAAPAAASEKK